jgi:hypothetical protein
MDPTIIGAAATLCSVASFVPQAFLTMKLLPRRKREAVAGSLDPSVG